MWILYNHKLYDMITYNICRTFCQYKSGVVMLSTLLSRSCRALWNFNSALSCRCATHWLDLEGKETIEIKRNTSCFEVCSKINSFLLSYYYFMNFSMQGQRVIDKMLVNFKVRITGKWYIVWYCSSVKY